MADKYYIIGSGIVGSVVAHELAEQGNEVLIFEKRENPGGNLYDFIDPYGVHVHLYGPHIFHTNDKGIYDYVSNFCELNEYNLVCGSVIDGKCVKTAFDYTAIDTFFPKESEDIKEHIKSVFPGRKSATILEMLDCKDTYVKKFAQFLYDKDYKPYTAKQWGISPDEVDRQVFQRVPVLFSYGSKYFNDEFQAVPVRGYMELIGNLLKSERIMVQTRADALDYFHIRDNDIYFNGSVCEGKVIYTGAIDELFGCRYGKLPYRSLRFEWHHEELDSFQDMPVVAYPQAKGFTRITEYKKLPYQNVQGTTYAVEYPFLYQQGEKMEPYYPVLTDESQKLYMKYKGLASKVNRLICCGRLADFQYYNMDQAIRRALDVVAALKGKDAEYE